MKYNNFNDKKIPDTLLLVSFLILVTLGIGILFSASFNRGEFLKNDPFDFIRNQIYWLLISIFVGIFIYLLDINIIRKLIPLMVIINLLLLIAVPLFGAEYNGAKRWLSFGAFSIQPSELAKVVLLMYLSHIFDKRNDTMQNENQLYELLVPFSVSGLFLGLIVLENDFSTMMFLLIVVLSLFFIAGVKIRYFILLFLSIIPIGAILILIKPYRMERIKTFLNPELSPYGSGYQILSSLNYLKEGGLLGKGLGLGNKESTLPEAYADFIFAVVGKEMGFIGVILIIIIFSFFAYRGYLISYKSYDQDRFISFLAFSLTTVIFGQAMLNMGVVSRLFPPTGINLPFFSNGGTSMLVNSSMVFLLLNLSKEVNYDDKAFI